MTEERKLVTVLFADIVGSTATGLERDPEIVRRTLARAFAQMRQILEAHGATVEKFIGDAVMAVFGVPTTHDDDADRAVRAAFALRRTTEAAHSAGGIPLTLRIGVNTGQVVAGIGGETLVTGNAVNEAARLQQAAGPGEILVGELTHDLTRGGVRYGAARSIAAKGIGEVLAYPAEDLTTAVPEQHRGIAGLRAPLVGRDDELRLLADAFRKTASEQRAALVTVFGSAGVGKSRLVREFVDTVGGASVRRGRCLPYGEGITYWPVTEMLREDARIASDDTREQARSKLRAATLAAFGEASADADAAARRLSVLAGLSTPDEDLPDVTADQLQREVHVAFRRYLERSAQRHPIVLVFDDIHWAEPPLLDLIEHLTEWSRAPIFLVCIARPELRDRRKGWGGGLMNASAIALEPLSADESRRLVADLLDIDDLPEQLRAEVLARAEGNPLYLEEFLRMLIDAGHIARQEGRWVAARSIADLVVPPTLQGLIGARLDQAPVAVKHALRNAAVIGKVFWTDALSALDGDERPEDALLEAARRDIVLELDERGIGGGATFQFRHILIRDVAYASIPKEERVQLHDRFSRWLERTSGERADEYADIVSYHAEQAFRHADELGEPSAVDLGRRALTFLLAGGRRAWRRHDVRAIRSFYTRATEVAERSGASDAERAEAVVYAAIARAWEETSPEAIAGLRDAVVAARSAGSSVALAHGLVQLSYLTVTSADDAMDEALHQIEEALTVARATGDHEVIVAALRMRAGPPWWRGDLAGHRRHLEEALAYAREHDVRRELTEILGWLASNAAVQGDTSRARALRDEFSRLVTSSGSLMDHLRLCNMRRTVALQEDRPVDAVRSAREGVELAERVGQRELVGRAHEFLSDALFESGDAAGARDALIESLHWYDRAASRASLPEAYWRLSRAYLALGDLAAARAQAEAGRASVIATDVFSVATTTTALAAVRSAEGDDAEAERLFAEAIALIGRTGYKHIRARIDITYADHLIARRRFDEARKVLRRASALAGDARLPQRMIEERLRTLEVTAAG